MVENYEPRVLVWRRAGKVFLWAMAALLAAFVGSFVGFWISVYRAFQGQGGGGLEEEGIVTLIGAVMPTALVGFIMGWRSRSRRAAVGRAAIASLASAGLVVGIFIFLHLWPEAPGVILGTLSFFVYPTVLDGVAGAVYLAVLVWLATAPGLIIGSVLPGHRRASSRRRDDGGSFDAKKGSFE